MRQVLFLVIVIVIGILVTRAFSVKATYFKPQPAQLVK